MIVFAVIADRDINFFISIAKRIQKKDPSKAIAFISFYEPGNKNIKLSGFKVYNIYDYLGVSNPNIFNDFDIDDIHEFTLHESVTFNVSRKSVQNKYGSYLPAINEILKEILLQSKNDEVTIYQELGGFVAPMSLFFVSKKLNINHIFFEPSFFKGRLFFVKNDYKSLKIMDNIGAETIDIKSKLHDLSKNKTTVIPDKDKHHFKLNVLKKISTSSNLKKIFRKLLNKYLLNQKEEYNYVLNHIKRNIKYAINSFAMKKLYSDSISNDSFNIYFPLHVPLDYALTIRAPKYFDQLQLIEQILEFNLDRRFNILIKEHPASIGGFSAKHIRKIIKKYPHNFKILSPNLNTYDIIKKIDLTLTINSKSGAEALSQNKPVVCLGDSFYMNSSEVIYCNSLDKLKLTIDSFLRDNVAKINIDNVVNFFQNIYNISHELELYSNDDRNLNNFATKILKDQI